VSVNSTANARWDDCNGDPSDGAETDINSNAEHCRACGLSCFGAPCVDGVCAAVGLPVGIDGAPPSGLSFFPTLSPDGRWLVFGSLADNLVEGDDNEDADIFLLDRALGVYRLLSGPEPEEAPVAVSPPFFWSDDGHSLCFVSYEDQNERCVVHDLGGTSAQSTRLADCRELPCDQSQRNRSRQGWTVWTDHRQLPDQPGPRGLILERPGHPRLSLEPERFGGLAMKPNISRDGRFVAYHSVLPDPSDPSALGKQELLDIVVLGTPKSADELLSESPNYRSTRTPSPPCEPCSDGTSCPLGAWPVPPTCCNGCRRDYLTDAEHCGGCGLSCYGAPCVEGVCGMALLSVTPDGRQVNGDSRFPQLSGNGRLLTFRSWADGFGRSTPPQAQLVVDRATDEVWAIRAADGSMPNGWLSSARFSQDGSTMVFLSAATNLSQEGTCPDIFVYDVVARSTERLGQGTPYSPLCAADSAPTISANGRFVAFSTGASFDEEQRCCSQVYVFDRISLSYEWMSLPSEIAGSELYSLYPSLSADGQVVAYTLLNAPGIGEEFDFAMLSERSSGASELIAKLSMPRNTTLQTELSGNGRFVVFNDDKLTVYDRETGESESACVNSKAEPGERACKDPSISHDGRFIAFTSMASNLSQTGDSAKSESLAVFVRDREQGLTFRLDRADDGEPANQSSENPVISADGRWVAFDSAASNLVSVDINGVSDVFVVGVPGAQPSLAD
jgi:Tol biopolymer transport system component